VAAEEEAEEESNTLRWEWRGSTPERPALGSAEMGLPKPPFGGKGREETLTENPKESGNAYPPRETNVRCSSSVARRV
jgi:hypothetical protein